MQTNACESTLRTTNTRSRIMENKQQKKRIRCLVVLARKANVSSANDADRNDLAKNGSTAATDQPRQQREQGEQRMNYNLPPMPPQYQAQQYPVQQQQYYAPIPLQQNEPSSSSFTAARENYGPNASAGNGQMMMQQQPQQQYYYQQPMNEKKSGSVPAFVYVGLGVAIALIVPKF